MAIMAITSLLLSCFFLSLYPHFFTQPPTTGCSCSFSVLLCYLSFHEIKTILVFVCVCFPSFSHLWLIIGSMKVPFSHFEFDQTKSLPRGPGNTPFSFISNSSMVRLPTCCVAFWKFSAKRRFVLMFVCEKLFPLEECSQSSIFPTIERPV